MPTTAAQTAEQIRSLIRDELPALTALRHDLHRRPELMFEERRTAARVSAELTNLGIAHKTGLAPGPGVAPGDGTGVLGHLEATAPGRRPAVALRADMDALPIEEATGKPYASATPGVMHACGHDGHTAILIGAARVLSKLETRPNPVTFVFQPAEEGGGGGGLLCDQGALLGSSGGGLGTPVGRIYGLHGWPEIPLGSIATKPGPLLAATDDFVVRIRGTQGHAAYPHLATDQIVCAASVIQTLQTISSRAASPLDAVVCTVGSIHGGSANNVIPAEVELVGTVRSLTPETRRMARSRFMAIVEQTSSAHGCRAEIAYTQGYPVTSNDPAEAERVLSLAREVVGADHVQVVSEPSMGGEDFSYYGAHVPACFYLLGLRPPGAGPTPQLHQPEFDFNDEALGLGVEMMVRLALS